MPLGLGDIQSAYHVERVKNRKLTSL